MNADLTDFWLIHLPESWPQAPKRMSVSALLSLEQCPRQWALTHAPYPELGLQHGYPRTMTPAAVKGETVHRAVQTIARGLVRGGANSVADPKTVAILRGMGGLTRAVATALDTVLDSYASNPRSQRVADGMRKDANLVVPVLRQQVQAIMSGVCLSRHESCAPLIRESGRDVTPLIAGSRTEVRLRPPEFPWIGVADLINVDADRCEIVDYKAGSPASSHEFQILVYALLWSLDTRLNPSARMASCLRLLYPGREIVIDAPDEHHLRDLQDEISDRADSVGRALESTPPPAEYSKDYCSYCAVRHMCDDYWTAIAEPTAPPAEPSRYIDAELVVGGRRGPSSWDAGIERAIGIPGGSPAVLLLSSDAQYFPDGLQEGQTCRLLAFRLDQPLDGAELPVLSCGRSSEMFRLR